MKPLCSAVRTQHKLVSRNVGVPSTLSSSSKVVGLRLSRSHNFVVRRRRGYSASLTCVRCSLTGDGELPQNRAKKEPEPEDAVENLSEGVEEVSAQGVVPESQDQGVEAEAGVSAHQDLGAEGNHPEKLQEEGVNHSMDETANNEQEQQILETKGSKLAKMLLSFDPLELSDLQKNVSREAVMAIKRVLTGTFGTLPSEQYTVTVETNREVLSGLLRSALYTGYVLRNLEYRLSLHKTLLLNSEEPIVSVDEKEKSQEIQEEYFNAQIVEQSEEPKQIQEHSQFQIKGLPPEVVSQLPKEAIQYIQNLEQKVEQNIEQQHHQSTMDETVDTDQLGIPNSSYGNDLLDLLRSLNPTTAKTMAKPSSKDTDHAFHLVIESVLSRLYPTLTEQSAEITDEQQISVTRDYLARILYWSMLLGNHGRGLEYNLSLEHAFEHINVEHPLHDGEGPGSGFFGAIGSFFFGESGQKAGEGESSGPVKEDDHKKQQQSSRKSEKDIDEMF